jgi:hypothetical protein
LFREAKAELSAAQADTRLSPAEKEKQILSLQLKVATLRPAAIMLADQFYDTVHIPYREAREAEEAWIGAPYYDPKKLYAGMKAMSGYNELTWAFVEADRLRGQARETPRSFAEDAGAAEGRAEARAAGPSDPTPRYMEDRTPDPPNPATPAEYAQNIRNIKTAAEFAVLQWEKALADAVLRKDPEEAAECRGGLHAALYTFELTLKWSEKKPAE